MESYDRVIGSVPTEEYGNKIVRRLSLPSHKGFTVIEVNEIVSLNANLNNTVFNLISGEKIEVSRAIKEYEHVLNPSAFFRVHKSNIIHLKYLREFSKTNGNFAVMTDNSSIVVSRRRLAEFIKAVENYNTVAYRFVYQ